MPKVPENISNNRGNNCLQKKKLWAIIVGINQYDDFEELKFCANDAVAFANTLQKVATQELPAIGAIFDEIQIILQGELLHTLQGHTEFLSDIAFSPDGKTIASASGDNSIKLWNLNGELIHTLQGHTGSVYEVVFSPDGKTIASGSWDKTVKLWNLNGELIHTLKGHTEFVYKIAFSPDGKTIASGSGDKTVKLWNFDLETVMTRGCNWVKDYLANNTNIDPEDRHICDPFY